MTQYSWGLWLPVPEEDSPFEISPPQIVGFEYDLRTADTKERERGTARWSLEEAYALCECRLVDVVSRPDVAWDLILDDEGLLVADWKPNRIAMQVARGFMELPVEALAGSAVIVRENGGDWYGLDPHSDELVRWVMSQWQSAARANPSLASIPNRPLPEGFVAWPGPVGEGEPLGD